MASFGWKRKNSIILQKPSIRAFEENEQAEEDVDENFDWMTATKRQKLEALEDNKALFLRLKNEGTTLAESAKFWQAINRWDNALTLNNEDASIFEMKAQALINLHEWIDAIKAAEKATQLKPNWWVGFQTLGRAQMGIGEVNLALRSFKIALHLYPEDHELRKDDLEWALSILNQKKSVLEGETENDGLKSSENSIKLRE